MLCSQSYSPSLFFLDLHTVISSKEISYTSTLCKREEDRSVMDELEMGEKTTIL